MFDIQVNKDLSKISICDKIQISMQHSIISLSQRQSQRDFCFTADAHDVDEFWFEMKIKRQHLSKLKNLFSIYSSRR